MSAALHAPRAPYDVAAIRRDFPILQQAIHGQPLAYLDNAATSQKPRAVIDALARFYEHDNGAVHRAVHQLGERSTEAYEGARATVARFLGASGPGEIVFVRGTTEAINLVAGSWGPENVGADDEILITELEHHSNIVPWQLLCERVGARLRVAPIDDRGQVILEELEARLSPRTRLVAVSHVSNALGTVVPVEEIVGLARRRGVPVLVDGAQAAPHMPVDVRSLGCDFYAFSGHKILAPTGIGVLWARREILEAMPPWQGGGGMIASVGFDGTTYAGVPERFEAGSPNTGGAVGLAAAIDYMAKVGPDRVAQWEAELLAYATGAVASVPGIRLIGTAEQRASVLSFVVDGVHAHDVGSILDREGVAVRVGHHCAQPVMDHFGVPATVRASLALYNDRSDVDALVRGLGVVRELFG